VDAGLESVADGLAGGAGAAGEDEEQRGGAVEHARCDAAHLAAVFTRLGRSRGGRAAAVKLTGAALESTAHRRRARWAREAALCDQQRQPAEQCPDATEEAKEEDDPTRRGDRLLLARHALEPAVGARPHELRARLIDHRRGRRDGHGRVPRAVAGRRIPRRGIALWRPGRRTVAPRRPPTMRRLAAHRASAPKCTRPKWAAQARRRPTCKRTAPTRSRM